MKEGLKKLGIIGSAIVAGIPFVSGAQAPVPPPNIPGPLPTVTSGINLLRQVLFWFATIFWILAALFVIYAAFVYLTAAGDPEKVKKANHQLIYAVVAIAVGILAYSLPTLVGSFLLGQ